MPKMVSLTIDGIAVTVPEGMVIVDAAKQAGVVIPVFCYHPKMEPVGMCRMCLVEIGRPVIDRASGQPVLEADGSPKIQFSGKLETACTTPVAEGMQVLGASDKAKRGRKDILEFLLTSHPLDCPICDKGGECPLQNQTLGFGPGVSRYIYAEKMHLAKHVPLGELIYLDRERCIQCGRCVRFQEKVVGEPVIGFHNRGRAWEIITASEPGFDSIFSGNTTDICPVGALTTADFRFGARPWELNAAASICPHCPVGCNLTFNTRREAASDGKFVIKRVMPRQNEAVNEIWICDKGRFAYHYTESKERLSQPLIRKKGELVPTSWDEALDKAAQGLRLAGKDLLTLAGGRLSNEDLFNLRTLTQGLGGKLALNSTMAGGDLVAQAGVGQGTNFSEMGKGTAILVVASDLHEEAPVWWLRVKQAAERGASLIVATPRPTRLDSYAQFTLRYPYGGEAAAVLAMVNALSAKRPDISVAGRNLARDADLQAAAEAFAQAENAIILFGSEGSGLAGSQALAQACTNLLIITGHTGRANNGLIGVWPHANEQGAWDMGFRPEMELKAALQAAKALYIVAADPVGDDPGALDGSQAFLVVQELFLSETARRADVVLPVQAFTERQGTYTFGERRVQRYYPALPAAAGSLPDFGVTARLARRLEIELEERLAAKVMTHIAETIPDYAGISYAKLAEVSEQWPIVGRGDLYYGGATYQNDQGLGVQLTPASQRGENVSLGWQQPSEIPPASGGLLAVPVTRLYDRGQTMIGSTLLDKRIGEAYVVIHPEDAAALQLSAGEQVEVELGGKTFQVEARLDANVPRNIVLVPRSMGLPVEEPQVVVLRVAERIK